LRTSFKWVLPACGRAVPLPRRCPGAVGVLNFAGGAPAATGADRSSRGETDVRGFLPPARRARSDGDRGGARAGRRGRYGRRRRPGRSSQSSRSLGPAWTSGAVAGSAAHRRFGRRGGDRGGRSGRGEVVRRRPGCAEPVAVVRRVRMVPPRRASAVRGVPHPRRARDRGDGGAGAHCGPQPVSDSGRSRLPGGGRGTAGVSDGVASPDHARRAA
jgi:hypothetical protein